MRNNIFLALFFSLFTAPVWAQEDSIPQYDDILSIADVGLKATSLSIDLSNPEDVDLALKKIHNYKYLESIIFEGEADENNLKKIFFRLSVLKNLTSLTFKDNEIKKMPDNIAALKQLQSLTIESNSELDYNDLFDRIKRMSLGQLNLIDNALRKTPSSLSEITSLKKIQVSGSGALDLNELMDALAKLPYLTTLALPVNYMTEVPKNISKLKALQILNVSNNNLMELPGEISGLKAINNLSIQGNLLLYPAKDLEKLKGNNIQYLALDKEISGNDIEQIKKMFPNVQIDFPISEDEEVILKTTASVKPALPVAHNGELKAKKEYTILSGAYVYYSAYFQNFYYNFDTLTFAERYKDYDYQNGLQIVNNNAWRSGKFYFRTKLRRLEKPGKKNEIWFRVPLNDNRIAGGYREMGAFGGMYWVYAGELNKREFTKKFLIKQEKMFDHGISFKRKNPRYWNDVRIELNENNSMFTFSLKGDTNFVQFKAYPMFPDVTVEKCQEVYNRKYNLYKKTLALREKRFNKTLSRRKRDFDRAYKSMKDYGWKETQLRMSDEEKLMKEEEWLEYYDAIIANEQKILDNSALSLPFIARALVLRGYNVQARTAIFAATPTVVPEGTKTYSVDFVDSQNGDKLAVASIIVVDNKNKIASQANGTLGFLPNVFNIAQYANYTLLVELRNGNWGTVSAEEIDKQAFFPNKTYQMKAKVFDKNLDNIGELLKSGIK